MRISKLLIITSAVALSASCSGSATPSTESPTTAEPSLGQEKTFTVSEALPPRVYRNTSGIELNMVFLEQGPNDELPIALVQFTGASFPTAGKVILARNHGRGATYQNWKIPYDGAERPLVGIKLVQGGSNEGELRVVLDMPRSQASSHMLLDLTASQAFDVGAFIETHKRHQLDGSLSALALIDRPYHEARHGEWLETRAEKVEEKCGQKIPYEVDFSTISDSKIDYVNQCAPLLDALAHTCRRDRQSRDDVLQRIKKVECAYGATTSLQLGPEGVIQAVIGGNESNSRKIMYEHLTTELGLGRIVLEDSQKRILVFNPDEYRSETSYLGTESKLNVLRVNYQSTALWDPHAKNGVAQLRRTDTGWKVECRKTTANFRRVDKKRRDFILKNAKFEPTLWKRREFSLARDNRGIYYYVDRLDSAFGGKSYRVFRGPRGQLTETKLVDIVDDSDGMIFATKRGKLRLVIGSNSTQEALWIEEKNRHTLVVLPIYDNMDLIYSGLGIYDSEQMGTICE